MFRVISWFPLLGFQSKIQNLKSKTELSVANRRDFPKYQPVINSSLRPAIPDYDTEHPDLFGKKDKIAFASLDHIHFRQAVVNYRSISYLPSAWYKTGMPGSGNSISTTATTRGPFKPSRCESSADSRYVYISPLPTGKSKTYLIPGKLKRVADESSMWGFFDFSRTELNTELLSGYVILCF